MQTLLLFLLFSYLDNHRLARQINKAAKSSLVPACQADHPDNDGLSNEKRVMEIQGDRFEAQKNYRAALSLDPSYEPALKNLQRATSMRWRLKGGIEFGEMKKEENQ